MNPHTRLAWTLGASLVMWGPAALLVFTGDIDTSTGGLYYLGALALAWLGMEIFDRIFLSYRRSAEQVAKAKRQIEIMERRAAAKPRRRRNDQAEVVDPDRPDGDLPPNV